METKTRGVVELALCMYSLVRFLVLQMQAHLSGFGTINLGRVSGVLGRGWAADDTGSESADKLQVRGGGWEGRNIPLCARTLMLSFHPLPPSHLDEDNCLVVGALVSGMEN